MEIAPKIQNTRFSIEKCRRRLYFHAFVLSVLLRISVSHALAEDLIYDAPQKYLGNADQNGFLVVTQMLGELDDDIRLPVMLTFSSGQVTSSPYFGRGWTCSVLESKAYMTSPEGMKVEFPWGGDAFLTRNPANSDEYISGPIQNRRWVARVDDHNITVTRADGWELLFLNGKITKLISDKGKVIDWIYSGPFVREIRTGKGTLLTCDNDSKKNAASLRVDNKHFNIVQEKVPVVKTVYAQQIIDHFESSLAKISSDKEASTSFTFSITEDRFPSLVVERPAGITENYKWNPANGFLIADSIARYKTTRSDNGDIDITKTNMDGSIDRHAFNSKEAVEISTSNGVTLKKYLFASNSILIGEVRKIVKENSNGQEIIYQAAFDENGGLLREISKLGVVRYVNTSNSQSAVVDGIKVWEKLFDSNGKLLKYSIRNRGEYEYNHLDSGWISEKFKSVSGTLEYTHIYDESKRLRRTLYPSGKEESFNYGKDGKLASRTDVNGNTWESNKEK
jgi:hypothetical protein